MRWLGIGYRRPLGEWLATNPRQVSCLEITAEHFFDAAATHLKDGGVFSYLTNEMDSLSRSHQRALFRRFRTISLRVLDDLGVPNETRDAQWAQSTVIVRAEK